MVRGSFITFEGGEGAGKSTQARALAHRLLESGREVVLTREPGGTVGAEAARAVLLSGALEARGPVAEAVVFAAARADHVDRVIRPALARGAVVISDRFSDSTRAYQGASGVPAPLIAGLERVALDGIVPDLTIILDILPRQGLARIAARSRGGRAGAALPEGTANGDRFERDVLRLHRARREVFLDIAAREPGRCLVVNATRPSPEIAEEIWRATVSRLFCGPRTGDVVPAIEPIRAAG